MTFVPNGKKGVHDLLDILKEGGWQTEKRGSGHWRAYPPRENGPSLTFPSTPSDNRAGRNMLGDVRRHPACPEKLKRLSKRKLEKVWFPDDDATPSTNTTQAGGGSPAEMRNPPTEIAQEAPMTKSDNASQTEEIPTMTTNNPFHPLALNGYVSLTSNAARGASTTINIPGGGFRDLPHTFYDITVVDHTMLVVPAEKETPFRRDNGMKGIIRWSSTLMGLVRGVAPHRCEYSISDGVMSIRLAEAFFPSRRAIPPAKNASAEAPRPATGDLVARLRAAIAEINAAKLEHDALTLAIRPDGGLSATIVTTMTL